MRFPVPLLPKRENFLYLEDQRTDEYFWTRFYEALRETKLIYGIAIDGLVARGGVVAAEEFAVISGAPKAMKKQVWADTLLNTLVAAGIARRGSVEGVGDCVYISRFEICDPDTGGFRARRLTEGIALDALREWIRKLGIGSYDAIAIRGDGTERLVGSFYWDLTAPSYLQALRQEGMPGFVAADVFIDHLNQYEVRYFVRKMQLGKL